MGGARRGKLVSGRSREVRGMEMRLLYNEVY